MHLYRACSDLREAAPDDAELPELRRAAAGALTAAGNRLAARGNARATVATLAQGLALTREDDPERLPLLYEYANIQAETGAVAEAQETWRQAERLAAESGDRRTALLALLARSDSTVMNDHTLGQVEEAARYAAVTQVGGAIELLAGDPAAAEAVLRRGYRVLEQHGERAFLPTVGTWLGRALAAQGRLEDARREADAEISDEHAAAAHAVLATADEPIARADALADLAVAAQALGREPEAERLFAAAAEAYRGKGSVAGIALLERRRAAASSPDAAAGGAVA